MVGHGRRPGVNPVASRRARAAVHAGRHYSLATSGCAAVCNTRGQAAGGTLLSPRRTDDSQPHDLHLPVRAVVSADAQSGAVDRDIAECQAPSWSEEHPSRPTSRYSASAAGRTRIRNRHSRALAQPSLSSSLQGQLVPMAVVWNLKSVSREPPLSLPRSKSGRLFASRGARIDHHLGRLDVSCRSLVPTDADLIA